MKNIGKIFVFTLGFVLVQSVYATEGLGDAMGMAAGASGKSTNPYVNADGTVSSDYKVPEPTRSFKEAKKAGDIHIDDSAEVVTDSGKKVKTAEQKQFEENEHIQGIMSAAEPGVNKTYKECLKAGGKHPECQKKADDYCLNGDSGDGYAGANEMAKSKGFNFNGTENGPCGTMAYALTANDMNIADEEIEVVINSIVEKDSSSLASETQKVLGAVNCLETYEAQNKQGQPYLKDTILDFLQPNNSTEEILTDIGSCSNILGKGFLNNGELAINHELLCQYFLGNIEVKSFFKQASAEYGETVITENHVGANNCEEADASGMSAAEQIARFGNDEQKAQEAKQCATETEQNFQYCKDYKAAMIRIGRETASPSGALEENRCQNAHDKAKKIFSQNIPKYSRKLLSSCIGLSKLSKVVKEQDEDVKAGTYTYEAIDSKQSGMVCYAKRGEDSPYALDFKACKKAVYWYNTFVLTNDLAAPVVGNAVETMKDMDNQEEMQKDMASGGVDAQSAGLRYQRKKYNDKAQMETMKMGLETGRALAMFGNMMVYPTPNLVKNEWCLDGVDNEYQLKQDFSCPIVYMASKNEEILKALFANQHVKGIMLKTGARALSKAVVHAITAKINKKQAKLVGKVEKALTDAEFNQPGNEIDMGPAFCDTNPNSPSCGGAGGVGGRTSTGGVDVSFGGAGGAGNGNIEFEGGEAGEGADGTNAIANAAKKKEKLGNILGGSSDNKGDSKKFNKLAAAKSGSGGGAGGGGTGGGGGGGLGGGGGGGAAPEARGPAGAKGGPGKKLKSRFQKGTGGRVTGGSLNGRKKKSRNPFASLGGRRGPSGGKSMQKFDKNLLPKTSKLFETISRRYAAVKKENRLMTVKE